MSKLVSTERFGAKIGIFLGSKGFTIIMLTIFMVGGAFIFAMIVNKGMSVRFVDELGKAFAFDKSIANRYSLLVFLLLGLAAYLMLLATGMMGKKIISEEVINGNGQRELKNRYIGEYDFYMLEGAIVGMEVFVLVFSYFFGTDFNWVNAAVVFSFQVFFVIFIHVGINVMRGARDLASRNIEKEHQNEHDLASENAKAALQGEQKPNEKAPEKGKTPAPKVQTKTVNLGGTDFEIKKSKVA